MTWFFDTPWWLSMLLVTGFCALLACGGHIVVRRTFAKTDFIQHNEVAGFIIAVVGVLYAVLLGFLTVIVWEQFADAEDRSVQEVDAATDIWRFSSHADAFDRARIRSDLKQYVVAVLFDEWPKMRSGGSSDRAQFFMTRLFGDAVGMRAATFGESNLQNRILDRVQVVGDLRRRRVNSNHSALPPIIWTAIVAGGVALISFIYLFGLQNFKAQLIMTGITAVMIGLCFSVVLKLDFPYRGDVSVSSERWTDLYDEMTVGHRP